MNDSAPAARFYEALPLQGTVNWWGKEIYFPVPLALEEKNTVEEMDPGDIAFWGPGNAVCIFLGETPISPPGRIIPASPVVLLGRIASSRDDADKIEELDPISVECG